MKNKIFNQKLLTAGVIVAMGLGFSTGAQASSAYAVAIQNVTSFSVSFDPSGAGPAVDNPVTGSLESTSECSTELLIADASDTKSTTFEFPPTLADPIDPDVSGCNIARIDNTYVAIKNSNGDNNYSSGDAIISETDLQPGGNASMSSLGESFTNIPLPLPAETYTGGGRNTFSATVNLLQVAKITISVAGESLTFAELIDPGFGSLAVANTKLRVTINNIDDPTNPQEVFVLTSSDVERVRQVESTEGVKGTELFDPFALIGTTGDLPVGKYEIIVANEQGASVKLTPTPPVILAGDHYLCYKSFGSFLRQEVNLVDQFDDVNFDVLKPKMFCNPAIKPELDPEVGILNPDAHLLSYKINEAHREPRHERQSLLMRDQFFRALPIQTVNPDRLMVPSGKSLDGTVPADQTGAINHFKCYRVRPLDGFQSIQVNVADQFTDPDVDLSDPLAEPPAVGKDLVLVRPTRMCTPVDKNGEGIIVDPNADPADPRDHLMCYRVKADRGVRLNRRTEVTSNNQFRDEDLVLKRELEFCAPATKTVITTEP